MKIGAYICNYNYSNFLQWAMRSMSSQTKLPDVLIFIDDASTDNSLEVLGREIAKNGDIFDEIVINDTNMGASKTMNKAVDILINKYNCDAIFGLAADDVIMPDYVEKTSKALAEANKNVGYIYTWVRQIGLVNQIDQHPEFDGAKLMQYPYTHGSSLIKAEAWKAVGGLPDLDFEEDYAMFKSMLSCGWVGKLVAEPLLVWRKHGKNRTIIGLNKLKGEKK